MTIDSKNGTGRAKSMGRAAVRGLALALVSSPGAVPCFTLSLVSLALIPVGVGLVTTPYVPRGRGRRTAGRGRCTAMGPQVIRQLPARQAGGAGPLARLTPGSGRCWG